MKMILLINVLSHFFSRCENNLETTKTGSHFFFYSVLVLYCKCHKINFGGDGSYIGLLG